ncbi:beta-1,6-N-acetylglucosaminyltransferase [Autumnicola psychrophila]|uniref:Peptide O-xylosyltransferase n=1 Tax=Autumnicola psychrophila TaxID=3075592 RepID=A0ABU3DT09_9FLAO|nr:beta-1,6-N-acetylglucosaminyltransferase [Zunongwangia sp. F225]MDT0686858.1 beta-1,6-N-acetylglucosaminyltransferase [Zunongwangia sp. F225]
MELNYLILAHKNPLQVKRLILSLESEETSFYIHIDLQASIDEFKQVLLLPNIYFLNKRYKGTWGDIGIVKATLYGMQEISRNTKKGYCILLSGQDYPLVSRQKIKDLLKEKFPTEFLTVYPMPHFGWKYGGMDRLEKYKIIKSKKRKHFLQLPSIFDKEFYSLETFGKLNFLRKNRRFQEMSLVLKKRKFPNYLKAYGGSQWWALTMETTIQILNYVDKHLDYLEYHKYSLLPDEIFFHSILMQLQEEKTEKISIEKSFTYVNWERPETPLPVTFEEQDFNELQKASKNYLFARKFDIKLDSEILDAIDKKLLQ